MTDSSPTVSVVMGVYNNSALLPETIESTLNQDYGDFEFVIVNDGSSEPGVADFLNEYARRDARIRVLSRPHKGLTRALIAGCAEARGRYLARIDAGDDSMPSRLRCQVEAIEVLPEIVLVSCATARCGPCWEPLGIQTAPITPPEGRIVLTDTPETGLATGPTSHVSVLMRQDAYRRVGGYREAFYMGQDWDLWYRLAEIGRFVIMPDVLCRSRRFPSGLTAARRPLQKKFACLSREAHVRRRRGQSEHPCLEAAFRLRPANRPGCLRRWWGLADGNYLIGAELYRNRDARCRCYLWRAWRRRPWSPRMAWRLLQALAISANGKSLHPSKEQRP